MQGVLRALGKTEYELSRVGVGVEQSLIHSVYHTAAAAAAATSRALPCLSVRGNLPAELGLRVIIDILTHWKLQRQQEAVCIVFRTSAKDLKSAQIY